MHQLQDPETLAESLLKSPPGVLIAYFIANQIVPQLWFCRLRTFREVFVNEKGEEIKELLDIQPEYSGGKHTEAVYQWEYIQRFASNQHPTEVLWGVLDIPTSFVAKSRISSEFDGQELLDFLLSIWRLLKQLGSSNSKSYSQNHKSTKFWSKKTST